MPEQYWLESVSSAIHSPLYFQTVVIQTVNSIICLKSYEFAFQYILLLKNSFVPIYHTDCRGHVRLKLAALTHKVNEVK